MPRQSKDHAKLVALQAALKEITGQRPILEARILTANAIISVCKDRGIIADKERAAFETRNEHDLDMLGFISEIETALKESEKQ